MENRVCFGAGLKVNKSDIKNNNKQAKENQSNNINGDNISNNNNQCKRDNETLDALGTRNNKSTRISYYIYRYLERTIGAVVLLVGRVLATVYSFFFSVRARGSRQPLGQLKNVNGNTCSGSMVKKRQSDAQQDGGSWSDSGEEEMVNGHAAAGSNAPSCQHIKKAVDPTRLRRHLKSTGLLYDCQMCQKLNPPSESGNESAACEYDNTLWLCLKCGTQLCSRERNKHALLHYQVKAIAHLSDLHIYNRNYFLLHSPADSAFGLARSGVEHALIQDLVLRLRQ